MHLRQVLAAAKFAPVGLDASWIERSGICGLDVLYLVLATATHAKWLLLKHTEQLFRVRLLAAERLEHFHPDLRFLRRLRLLVRPCATAVIALIRQPVEDGCRGHFLEELGILQRLLVHLAAGLLCCYVFGGLIILESLAAGQRRSGLVRLRPQALLLLVFELLKLAQRRK